MDEHMLKGWLGGLDRALDALDAESRAKIFTECGKACADSFILGVYREAFDVSTSLADFAEKVHARLPAITITLIRDDVVEVSYPRCYCEFVTEGYIRQPGFCECSRRSLIYNWETLLGPGSVTVEALKTVLGGNDECRFRVTMHHTLPWSD